MTLIERKIKILELDPYQIVKCDMDSFCPYVWVDLPEELRYEGTEEECDEFNDWLDEYIAIIQDFGSEQGLKKLKDELLINRLVDTITK